ncbi:MAG: hypothetical protein A3F72_08410 [Bacteroidetes bacterium RIFCSPLOWO2_12_FULL_35_15]|nr:MAG: hypothetical protein A3F72_08410 [Bacteroidetes bacterium RIFCSPLOWO2_12_FULL_35_15]
MHKLILFLLLVSLRFSLPAQELNCQVQVLTQQISGTDKRVFDALQTAIFEFLNNKKWTTETFKTEERIDCSILINITEKVSNDEFKATLQVQARRPIFKTSYNSPLLNFNDNDIQFKYIENQALDFTENTYTSELTSILAFYANLIIGMDYDTFSMNGGTTYLQKALAVVNSAQNASGKGWKAFDGDKNRYWIINNMLDASFVALREGMYNYHRKGLDEMVDNKESGRAAILESLADLKKVHEAKPLSFSLQVFFNAKADEIINIFSGGFSDEKSRALNILNEIDPTNSNKYQKIMATQ